MGDGNGNGAAAVGNELEVTEEGLLGLYTPPREANTDESIAVGQGFGYAPFRACRIFRILTGTISTDLWYAGSTVVVYGDGDAANKEFLLGTAFEKTAGDAYSAESMGLGGGAAGDSGALSEADTMVIAGDANARGITRPGSHFKVRGALVRLIDPFCIPTGTTANYLRTRRSPSWLKDGFEGKTFADRFREAVARDTFIRIRDQRNNSGCLERLGNLGLWQPSPDAKRSDSWWYTSATYISNEPGSESVVADVLLGNRVEVEGAPDSIPVTTGQTAPAYRFVYGFDVVLVGESAPGKGSQQDYVRQCGRGPSDGSRAVKEVRNLAARVDGMESILREIRDGMKR